MFPEMPSELRKTFPDTFWFWWQAFKTYMLSEFSSQKDVEILTIGSGVVLKSPDGTRWRITVDDAGGIIVTAV